MLCFNNLFSIKIIVKVLLTMAHAFSLVLLRRIWTNLVCGSQAKQVHFETFTLNRAVARGVLGCQCPPPPHPFVRYF